MTVKELIKELQKMDGNLEVSTEGCDCNGDVETVEYETYNEKTDGTGKQKEFCYLRRSR